MLPHSALLETCTPQERDRIGSELRIIQEITATGISSGRKGAINTTWDIWETFCADLRCDPFLQSIQDPIPLLQIFAHRYRTGEVAPSGAQVRSCTVEGALCAMGQMLSTLGSPDPRLQPSGKLDLQLSRQLSAYKKQDPPPTSVKPILFLIIAYTADFCCCANTPRSHTIANMLLLGFFFLLRPGEYAYTDNANAAPFCICDTHLMINNRRLHPYTSTKHELLQVNYIALEFTTQKNGVQGKLVGLG